MLGCMYNVKFIPGYHADDQVLIIRGYSILFSSVTSKVRFKLVFKTIHTLILIFFLANFLRLWTNVKLLSLVYTKPKSVLVWNVQLL